VAPFSLMLLIKRRGDTVTLRNLVGLLVARVYAPVGAAFVLLVTYGLTRPGGHFRLPIPAAVGLAIAIIAVTVLYYWRRLGNCRVEINATRVLVQNPGRRWEVDVGGIAEVRIERGRVRGIPHLVTRIVTSAGETIEPIGFTARCGWMIRRLDRAIAVMREEITARQAALRAAGG
jgi:hypothetical protein